jgi:subtilase family serine protease
VSVIGTSSYSAGSPGSATVTIADGADLTIKKITAPKGSLPGATINISVNTLNAAGGAAGASTTRVYLSKNKVVDGADTLIANLAVPALPGNGSANNSVNYTLSPGLALGIYYILAVADAGGVVVELNESNNLKFAAIELGPDLTISSYNAPASATAGSTIVASETTKNIGGVAAAASTTRVYLSVDKKFDASDVLLSSHAVPGLAVNGTHAFNHSLTLPPGVTGVRYVLFIADAPGAIAESNEKNNLKQKEITITP